MLASQPWFFLASLSWMCPPKSTIFVSFYACYRPPAWLVWAITSLVLLYVLRNHSCTAASLSVRSLKATAMHVWLYLAMKISPLPVILQFQNWGCIHYTGKCSNLVHRSTKLVSFLCFLRVSPDIMNIGYNNRIFQFYYSIVSSGLQPMCCLVIVCVFCPIPTLQNMYRALQRSNIVHTSTMSWFLRGNTRLAISRSQ